MIHWLRKCPCGRFFQSFRIGGKEVLLQVLDKYRLFWNFQKSATGTLSWPMAQISVQLNVKNNWLLLLFSNISPVECQEQLFFFCCFFPNISPVECQEQLVVVFFFKYESSWMSRTTGCCCFFSNMSPVECQEQLVVVVFFKYQSSWMSRTTGCCCFFSAKDYWSMEAAEEFVALTENRVLLAKVRWESIIPWIFWIISIPFWMPKWWVTSHCYPCTVHFFYSS